MSPLAHGYLNSKNYRPAAYTATIDQWWIDRERIVIVSLIEFAGRWRFDGRVWFLNDQGVLCPGRGLALQIQHLPRLAAAVDKACRGAIARDLIKPPQAIDEDA